MRKGTTRTLFCQVVSPANILLRVCCFRGTVEVAFGLESIGEEGLEVSRLPAFRVVEFVVFSEFVLSLLLWIAYGGLTT